MISICTVEGTVVFDYGMLFWILEAVVKYSIINKYSVGPLQLFSKISVQYLTFIFRNYIVYHKFKLSIFSLGEIIGEEMFFPIQ